MTEYKTYTNTYGTYAVPNGMSNNEVVAQYVERGDVWEQDTINFICENLNNKNIVHAGALFGDMLPAISKCTTGTVFAFEPVQAHYDCAVETVRLNNLQNVVLEKKGLGKSDNNKKMSIGVHDVYAGQSSVLRPNKNSELIEMTTIDGSVNGEIGIIHLDVEGYEFHVLRGAIETIRKYKPILILETKDDFRELLEKDSIRQFWETQILSLGYQITATPDENTVWQIL